MPKKYISYIILDTHSLTHSQPHNCSTCVCVCLCLCVYIGQLHFYFWKHNIRDARLGRLGSSVPITTH